MRKQNGITLIALVITIIVLLILAGISIAMLTGENGILTNAQNSKSQTAYAEARERMQLAYMAVRTEIAAQKAANSSYSAIDNNNTTDDTTDDEVVTALLDIVKADLNVSATATATSTWYAEIIGDKIVMTYNDSAIDQYSMSETEPANDGKVYAYIDVDPQTASFTFDVAAKPEA